MTVDLDPTVLGADATQRDVWRRLPVYKGNDVSVVEFCGRERVAVAAVFERRGDWSVLGCCVAAQKYRELPSRT